MVLAYISLPSISFTKKKFPNGFDDEALEKKSAPIVKLNKTKVAPTTEDTEMSENTNQIQNTAAQIDEPNLTFKQKLRLIPKLFKYMIPLFVVYVSQYFINQGLFELLYFKDDSFLSEHKSQYRWYSALYGTGVFISRTSIRFVQIKFLPIFPALQLINVAIALTQIFFNYFPSIWFIFVIILWEGVVAGACYVNAFNLVTVEITKQKEREFSIQFTSLANSIGVATAGAIAIPVHNAICEYGYK